MTHEKKQMNSGECVEEKKRQREKENDFPLVRLQVSVPLIERSNKR